MQREEVEDFNNTLLELFSVIPRKMGNVNDYLSRSKEDFARILKDEQDLLDVMRGQVVTHTVQDEPDTDDVEEKQETIIEAMGLEFEEVTEDDVRMIKSLLWYLLCPKSKKIVRLYIFERIILGERKFKFGIYGTYGCGIWKAI